MMAEKDNTPIGESDELSVTEVSKEVLDELSVLFGDSSRDDTVRQKQRLAATVDTRGRRDPRDRN